ncbi:MAG: hypothetical protein CM1200mP30_31850 [Pseudomonadota bacterium]|nr:MAG: hypothetical protein CM1200mP30_31850 [Pseudomonadota bacterium]
MIEEADVLIDAIFGIGMEQSMKEPIKNGLKYLTQTKGIENSSGYSFRGFNRRKQDSWSGSTMSSHNYFSVGKTGCISIRGQSIPEK